MMGVQQIETALLQRLHAGLGRQVSTITAYGGELDGDIAEVVRRLPAIWVTYAGGGKPQPYATDKRRWLIPAQWAVMVGCRNVQHEGAARSGSAGQALGSYTLLEQVRALLMQQDLGLAIEPFTPGPVRTLYNTLTKGQAWSVLAIEFSTRYVQGCLPPGKLPSDPQPPDLLRIGLNYHLQPDDGKPDAVDKITL